MMKKIICTTTFLLLIFHGNSQPDIKTSKYFEFHNNYWINLHHFLYQKAKGSQLNKLVEDGLDFQKIGEDSLGLSRSETAVLNTAISYYKKT